MGLSLFKQYPKMPLSRKAGLSPPVQTPMLNTKGRKDYQNVAYVLVFMFGTRQLLIIYSMLIHFQRHEVCPRASTPVFLPTSLVRSNRSSI